MKSFVIMTELNMKQVLGKEVLVIVYEVEYRRL